MNARRHFPLFVGFVLSVSLLCALLTAVLLTNYHSRVSFQILGNLCEKILEKQPEAASALLSSCKELAESKRKPAALSGENFLSRYGYRQSDFAPPVGKYETICAVFGFLAGGVLSLLALFFWRKKEISRIEELTDYLEKINTGDSGVLPSAGEDSFSKLQDEIYKTVTELRQTRAAAIQAKNNFAENLSNIAHQLKTPITSISLSLQMMQKASFSQDFQAIQQQLSRLTHLEEALLLLSRVDAGTLPMEKKDVDVFTLLMLAADNLQELAQAAEVSVEIPESGEVWIQADLEWTMEAVINLLKNCIEHTPPGGTVRCSYAQNPLYTNIRIQDTGSGFAREDLPHLFERFYRGERAAKGGIGIGLALAKAIIENQNGVVQAQNADDGGACFEIHFYCH